MSVFVIILTLAGVLGGGSLLLAASAWVEDLALDPRRMIRRTVTGRSPAQAAERIVAEEAARLLGEPAAAPGAPRDPGVR